MKRTFGREFCFAIPRLPASQAPCQFRRVETRRNRIFGMESKCSAITEGDNQMQYGGRSELCFHCTHSFTSDGKYTSHCIAVHAYYNVFFEWSNSRHCVRNRLRRGLRRSKRACYYCPIINRSQQLHRRTRQALSSIASIRIVVLRSRELPGCSLPRAKRSFKLGCARAKRGRQWTAARRTSHHLATEECTSSALAMQYVSTVGEDDGSDYFV